jgi:hypothetical protein
MEGNTSISALLETALREGFTVRYVEIVGRGVAIDVSGASVAPRACGPVQDTLEDRIDALLEGTGPRRPAEWAALISNSGVQRLSLRELERALAAGALKGAEKGRGRDHRAVLVEPDEIKQYLQLCAAVQDGLENPPCWWNTVRKGTNANFC